MAQQVVTELVIDSSRAVSGANEYTRAMDGAQSAMQRSLGAMSDGIAEVRDGIAGMGQAATNIVPSVGQLAIGIGAAGAAVLAMSALVKEFTRGLADMGQAARRAGLDVESFQKLQFAASLEGIANKDFSSGVEKMAMRLNDASRNENDLSKLLDANNIKFKDANGTLISTNALLEKARDLISREPIEQNKRVIAEMLGLTKEWVPLLDKSAQAFAASQDEAKALGLVINADVIKKAEDFDREWRKSSTVFSTWIKAQLAELLPLLDDLISRAGDFAASVKSSLDAAANSPAGQEFTARSNRAATILEMLSSENDAKENADIVAAAAKAMAGTLSDATTKLLDQQIAVKSLAQFWNDYAASMFNAASASDKYLKSLAANDNGPRPIIPAKDTTDSKDALDRSIESLKRHTEVTLADADAQGLGAQALQEYRAIAELVAAAERAGVDVTGKLGEKFADLATKAGEAARALAQAKVDSNIDFATKTRLLSNDDVAIATQLRGIYGNDVPAALASTEASQMRLNGAIREGRDNAINFVDTLVKGLFDAKAGSDSVAKGLEALSKSLASTAIKQLLSGDFEKAAVSAISAVVTWVASLVSHANDLKGTIDTLDRLNQLRLRFVQATNDTNTLQGQLAVFDANAVLQQIDEARKGGALMNALLQVQSAERLKIETDFQKQAAEIEKQAADARLARQQSLEDRIFAATNDTSTLQGALAAQQRDFAKERLDEAKNGNLDLAQLTIAQQDEELALRKSFNDKAIAETKRAEQERLDAINGTAKSVVDYLNGLVSGPSSTLSPTATLANAQSVYNANLGLAQVGNIDAQNKFVSLADNLEKAARAVYASGQGYQDIRSQIISQGLALPAVQQTTDPVVIELRNVLTAINSGNTILSSNAQAIANLLLPTMGQSMTFAQFVQGITGNTLSTIDAPSGIRLQNVFNELDGNGNGILEKSEAIKAATQGTAAREVNVEQYTFDTRQNVSAGNTVLSAIQGLQGTAAQQLQLLNQQLSGSATVVVTPVTTVGNQGKVTVTNNYTGQSSAPTSDVANNMLTALNKIVINTWATATNTHSLMLPSGGLFDPPLSKFGVYAQGGTIPPFGLGLVSEHLNPTFMRAGPEPIHVFPGAPSNDNSALLAEVRALRAEVASFRKENGINTMNAAGNVCVEVKATTGAVKAQTDTLAAQERQTERKRKVANG
jgi:hypothetical protein